MDPEIQTLDKTQQNQKSETLHLMCNIKKGITEPHHSVFMLYTSSKSVINYIVYMMRMHTVYFIVLQIYSLEN